MEKEETTLIFVRHGQTVWNSQGRWQGWLDSPLSEQGVEQARRAADELRDTHIDAVYCSDAGRAMHTAKIIAASHGLKPVPDTLLRERFYGGHEGLTAREIEEKHPGSRFSAARGDTRETYRPPGGETMAEVRERLKRFLANRADEIRGKTVLIVTHSGVVRTFDSLCQQKTLDEIWDRVPQNCCLFIANANGDGRYQITRDFHPHQHIEAKQ